jgi:type I restriction enzyme S subunit
MVKMSDLVTQINAIARTLAADELVRFAGVRWYGNGLFIREERMGGQTIGKSYPLVPGALIYNRLFGWKSAFALVPPEMSGVVVSNEFPQFRVNEEVADASFVNLVCGSAIFAEVMLSRSTGTTAVSRNRLVEQDFLDLAIPLPPLETQRRIVADHDAQIAEANGLAASAARRRESAWTAFEDALGVVAPESADVTQLVSIARFAKLSRWDTETADATMTVLYPMELLGAHAEVRLGCQVPRKGAHATGVERPYLRAANVRPGGLNLSDVKTMTVSQVLVDALKLQAEDLLFAEGSGSLDEVGRCATWDSQIPHCIHQNSVVRGRITSDRLVPAFAMAWFNSIPGSAYFRVQATTTSGLFHIGAGKTAGAPIPVPPVPIQEELAQALWSEIATADGDEALAADLRAQSAAEFGTAVFGEALSAEELSFQDARHDARRTARSQSRD